MSGRLGVSAKLFNTAGLRFPSQEDALNFARHSVEGVGVWFPSHLSGKSGPDHNAVSQQNPCNAGAIHTGHDLYGSLSPILGIRVKGCGRSSAGAYRRENFYFGAL